MFKDNDELIRESNKLMRRRMIAGMDAIVTWLNNEDAYYGSWIYDVPDMATEEDLNDIADDDESFRHTVGHFLRIMEQYGKDGICFNNELITKDTQ